MISITISTHNRYQKGKFIMDKNIIISNLKKDHFRITERYGKFILGAEYETIKKGRCISIEEYLFPDEFVSSAKAFIEETKAVLDSFTEFVNEFFTSSKPEMYDRSSEVMQSITHRSEEPEYRRVYLFPSDSPITEILYIIDDGDHSTMLLASEY